MRRSKSLVVSFFIYSILVIALAVFIAISPIFNINKIQVIGNKIYKSEDIIKASNLMVGKNWFKSIDGNLKDILTFRNSNAQKNVTAGRVYIKTVEVKYVLSEKSAIITIKEREPTLVVPYLGTNLILDKEKVVVGTLTDLNKSSLPVVKGLNFDKYQMGKTLQVTNAENMKVLYNVVNVIMNSDLGEKVQIYNQASSIDVSALPKLYFVLDGRILVKLEDYTHFNEYEMGFVRHVFLNNLSKKDKGSLVFTSNQNLKFIPNNVGG